MKKFKFNDYINKDAKYCMHCKNPYEATTFCQYLHSIRKKWNSGKSYAENNNFNTYHEDTVYLFVEGFYGDVDFAKEQGYVVLEFSDFCFEIITKASLETGDIILRRNGSVEILIKEQNVFITKTGGWNSFSDTHSDLTDGVGKEFDIVSVRRPLRPWDNGFNAFDLEKGELIYETQ